MGLAFRNFAHPLIERHVMRSVVGIGFTEPIKFCLAVDEFRWFDRAALQHFGVPALDRAPSIRNSVVPGERVIQERKPGMRPVAAQRCLRGRAQLICDDHQRVMSQLDQCAVESLLRLMAQLQSREFGVAFCIRQRSFDGVTYQKGMGHFARKPCVARQPVRDVIRHILEKNRGALRRLADHRADLIIGDRMSRRRREARKKPVCGRQIMVVHERFVQDQQIAALAHDPFKSRRNRTRVAPQSMYPHAASLVAPLSVRQRRPM